MNIKDKIVENLCNLLNENNKKEKLYELSMSKKYIIDKLYDIRIKLNYHLIYCYFYTNSDSYNHWKTEIAGLVKNLPRISGTNKYPSEKQLKKWVINNNIEEINENIDFYVQDSLEEENIKEIPKYNKQALINYLTEYWLWLSENISNGKNLLSSTVYNKIDELVEKYRSS